MAEEEATALTAAEYETWLSPSDALGRLTHLSAPKKTILTRLYHGLIRSVAHTVSTPSKSYHFTLLNKGKWQVISGSYSIDSSFWGSGDFTFASPDGRTAAEWAFFGVRFDPAGIDLIAASAPGRTTRTTPPLAAPPESMEPPKEAEADPPPKGPPVSDALLKGWYALYCQAYKGSAADTLPTAWGSASGMFPGKFVSRQRVRDLLSGRNPGPKKKGRET